MKESKFLGKDGLTQTSANHIANIAKEMYESLETKLDTIRLVSNSFTLAAVGTTFTVGNESTLEELQNLDDTLSRIARLKALIAWLREGIKAKEDLCTSESEDMYIRDLLKHGREDLQEPETEDKPTFESILATKPEAYQARYYTLEAKSATLGKYIHPDGHLAKVRKEFYNRLKNPTEIRGHGQDAEVYTYSTSFKSGEVDDVFFSLQKKYRSVQAEFNTLRAEIENELGEKLKDYSRTLLAKAENQREKVHQELLSYRKEVKARKIVIPESLRSVYAEVSAVAANK